MIQVVHTDELLARCFNVMCELRPHLRDAGDLVSASHAMRVQGAIFAALEHDGEIVTVTCYRIQEKLATGRTLYVDDLVTGERFRSRGHGKAMLDWLVERAREAGCETFSLDSGTFRHEAHAFYFREGMRIQSFHFGKRLGAVRKVAARS